MLFLGKGRGVEDLVEEVVDDERLGFAEVPNDEIRLSEEAIKDNE